MSKGSFFSFVAGALVGAAAAVLLSTDKGKEACNKLSEAVSSKLDELEGKVKSEEEPEAPEA